MRTAPLTSPAIAVPAGATPGGDGIVLGAGPVTVEAYVDFLCPFCRQFEERSGPLLDRLLGEEAITMIYHPLGFLDRLSHPAGYSSRAAAASGCASDAGHFGEYKDALFANQPEEGGPGLDDAELVALGRAIGIDDPAFADGVYSGLYLPWAAYVTEAAVERGVSGTPTVVVQGTPIPASPTTIAAAVTSAARR
jgi:protein-disulfide isomerase